MKLDPVRRLAHRLLVKADRGEPLDALLDRELARADERDRGPLAELVRGTLQWRGRYDHLISVFARRRPPRDPRLMNVLRLGLHQLVASDGVPDHAAVGQAAELCRREAGAGRVGFVNGLLRSVKRELDGDDGGRAERLRALFTDLESDRAGWLAAWYSHPRWLVERWLAAHGEERTAALCAWNNRPVPVVLHVLAPHDPGAVAAALADRGCPCDAGPGPQALTLGKRLARSELSAMLAATPEVIVQDGTVQEATAWLADGPEPTGAVTDLCAAPGGKSVHLSARWRGASVVAVEKERRRLGLLAQTVTRTDHGTVAVVRGDAARPPLRRGSCGAVLLDGPCSGTGVLRHHPDGRWNLEAGVPARRGAVLLDLARAAAELLAPAGRLMYATCSLEDEENGSVVASLLAERADLEPDPDPEGRWQRLWLPGESGGDGFYAARLRRVERMGVHR